MLVRGSLKVIDGGGGCTWFSVWAEDGTCQRRSYKFVVSFLLRLTGYLAGAKESAKNEKIYTFITKY
jgi:hypothetical protein